MNSSRLAYRNVMGINSESIEKSFERQKKPAETEASIIYFSPPAQK